MNDVRTFILGLDGADWSVLEPLIKEGFLPNFSRLYNGVHGPLDSTTPPLTPPGWTSSVTGRNPGKHNIFDFFSYSGKDYDTHLTSRIDRRCRAVWNYVSSEGGRVLVMNVPHTYPPEKVNGYLVTGFGTPEWDCEYTYPPELKKRILKAHPAFKVDMPSRFLHEGDFESFVKGVNAHCQEQFEVFCEFYAELKPHFAMFCFVEMDRLFHFFWKENMTEKKGPYAELFKNHFVFLDGLLGKFLDTLPENSVVMAISDHGFGEVKKDIYVNNYLRDKGYLSVKEGMDEVSVGKVAKWKLVVASALDRIGLWNIYLKHRRAQLEKRSQIGGGGAETVRSSTALSAIDWQKTKAYFSSMSARSVRLNLKGRDAMGTVDEKDYSELIEKLAADLLDLRDENGEKIIAKVFKAREIFKGEYVGNASDLYLEPAPGYSFNQGFGEKTVMPSTQHGQPRSGDHRQYGVYMLQGKGVKEGETLDASIMDVTPTILALMGIPLSNDLDGKVLQDALKEEVPVRRYEEAPYGQMEKNTGENEEKLQERLKDLGYL
ncbi:alkaline phosphatase family protein [bacterium]|nr:alkaline phosphatase family protein [bacterium]